MSTDRPHSVSVAGVVVDDQGRKVADGKDLYWWHPIVSGDPESVHLAGVSVRGKVVSETEIPVERFEERVVTWPMRVPRAARRRTAEPKG